MKSKISLCLLLSVFAAACNDNKSTANAVVSTSDSSAITTAVDTSKKGTQNPKTSFHAINVSQFKISRTDLAAQLSNNKKLLILKTHFSDLSTPTTLRVMLYPAKHHKDHAEGQPILGGVTDQGTTSIEGSNIIIGNNYIRLKKILKKDNGSDRLFSYLLIKPNTIHVPGHLVYQLTAVSVKKDGVTLDEEDLGYSNPSPPAPPLEN